MTARERARTVDAPFWGAVALVMLVIFMLRTTYLTMDDVTNARYDTLGLRLFQELTGTLTAIPTMVLAAWAARRAPLPAGAGGWGRTLTMHAAAFAAGTTVHTVLMAATRAALAPAMGFTGYDYGPVGLRLLMEAPNDLLFYAMLVAGRLVTDSRRRARAREHRTLELERELAQSRLENLQLQLQPHFLFNALNTISSVMYDDPGAADRMLGHLADLLRHAIGRAGTREIPLHEELQLLDAYLALARGRFGAALDVAVEVGDVAPDAAVPPLLLQPLVENALQHGVDPAGAGRVTIRVAQEGAGEEARLVLEVKNALPPTPEPARATSTPRRHAGLGVGLTVTRRRLALLHGDAGLLASGPTGDGDYRVVLTLPVRAGAGRARVSG